VVGTVGDAGMGSGRVAALPRGNSVPLQRGTAVRNNRVGRSGWASPVATTVLIADPMRATRQRWATELTRDRTVRVLQADSVPAVLDLVADATGGQLALVSLGFRDAAPALIDQLCRVPWTRVIALAVSAEPGPLLDAVAAGASGILRGDAAGADAEPSARLGRLTARELEVLTLVADGHSNKSIAEQLTLSSLTVKSHLSRISRKFGTGDRAHQVALAMRAGLLR
jgi:DNA-binding NarL/FixJ family response regulator